MLRSKTNFKVLSLSRSLRRLEEREQAGFVGPAVEEEVTSTERLHHRLPSMLIFMLPPLCLVQAARRSFEYASKV